MLPYNLMTCDTELLMLNYLMLMTANDTLSDWHKLYVN